MQINHCFLPGALLARAMGRQDCLGASMMLRRATLERIGGFPALVDHLADDNVLGRLVQGLGLTVALADTVPATTVPEATTAGAVAARTALGAHHPSAGARPVSPPRSCSTRWPGRRWRCCLSGGAPWTLAWFAAAWAARAWPARGIDQALDLAKRTPLWLLPLRELMSVAVMLASFAGRQVDWRGHTLQAEGFDPR